MHIIYKIIIMFFILAKVKTVGMFACGIDSYSVSSICGCGGYDSSFTKSNNHFMTVYLTEAGTVFGQRVSAKGLVNVLSEEQVVITSGIKIRLYGKFANDFFNCDSIQEWMLSTLSVGNLLSQSLSLKDRILLEHIPSANETLKQILQAMKKNVKIVVEHKNNTPQN